MRQSQEEQMERVALELIASHDGPVGATRLLVALNDHGITVAEATAGRFLRQLDARG